MDQDQDQELLDRIARGPLEDAYAYAAAGGCSGRCTLIQKVIPQSYWHKLKFI